MNSKLPLTVCNRIADPFEGAIADLFEGVSISVERGLFQFGYFIATVIPTLLARFFIKVGNGRPPRVKVSKDTSNEQERLAGCRDVVMQFAVIYGHIARECMSREELERLIDNGIAPQELLAELHNRIAAMPGVVLGVNSMNSAIEIKLPSTLRDRHCYIIGKSGSGKTNLIRNESMEMLGVRPRSASLQL